MRGPHVKVPHEVARLLRAGHPWVFRSAVQRPLAVAEGTVVPVLDADGYLVGHGLHEPEGAIAVRMLSLATDADFAWNEAEILARLRAALRRRDLGPTAPQPPAAPTEGGQSLAAGAGESAAPGAAEPAAPGAIPPSLAIPPGACRLLHAEADGFPGIAVDRLGDYLLVYKYARVGETYLDTLVQLLEQELRPAGIYMQDRIRGVTPDDRRPPAFHLAGKPAPPDVEVDEDGLKFLVDVTAPVSPGLFLD
ncbi:MAG TPA: hypothetical protein VIK91_17950, partial [Nannocystis sp.]